MGKFKVGEVVVTKTVAEYVEEIQFDKFLMMKWLKRHQNGDWGEMSEEYKKANDLALVNGQRVVSSHMLGEKIVWIVTESDRKFTAFMFPDQYSNETNFNM